MEDGGVFSRVSTKKFNQILDFLRPVHIKWKLYVQTEQIHIQSQNKLCISDSFTWFIHSDSFICAGAHIQLQV